MKSRATVPAYRVEDGKVCVDLRLRDARQLFDPRDPAPFQVRDLDERVVTWILESISDVGRTTPFRIVLHFEDGAGADHDALANAVRQHFESEIARQKRQRRAALREALVFLAVAILVLAICLSISTLARRFGSGAFAELVKDGVPIIGWVAVWRPLETFFFEWWPYQTQIGLCRRAAAAEITIARAAPASRAT